MTRKDAYGGDDAQGMTASSEPLFSVVLRETTGSIHRKAERTGVIADLLRGRATVSGYALYLANLLPVYRAMERRFDDRAAWSVPPAFGDPALRRTAAIEADLRVLEARLGQSVTMLPQAGAYVEAIDAASGAASHHRLTAHAYARYLGDLSGGQILKPLIERTLGLPPSALSFYEFPAVPDIDRAKSAMRAALDRVVVGSREAEQFVDEAIRAFELTISVSEAVAKAA